MSPDPSGAADMPTSAVARSATTGPRRATALVVGAWLALALSPVAFIAGRAMGEWVFRSAGYPAGGPHPIAIAAMAILSSLVLRMAPLVLAVWLAAAAISRGDERGRLPLRVGLILILVLLALAATLLLLGLLPGRPA